MNEPRIVRRHHIPIIPTIAQPDVQMDDVVYQKNLSRIRQIESPIEQLIALARIDPKANSISDIYIGADEEPWAKVDGKVVRWPNVPGFDFTSVDGDVVQSFIKTRFSDSLLAELVSKDLLYATTSMHDDMLGTVRIHACNTTTGQNLIIRLLPLIIPSFSELGLPKVIETFTKYHNGLILFSGSVGSGKSTAVAAFIDMLNEHFKYAICTVEDPVEFVHRCKLSRVKQQAIGIDVPDYAHALRSLLRSAPDVIFIGEMRDAETMRWALIAAETGHLVISTVHDNGASASIQRILGSFESDSMEWRTRLSQTLRAVVSLRLVPRAGGNGRIAAAEVLINNTAIRNKIYKGDYNTLYAEISSGGKDGMQTLEADLKRKAADGLIDPKLLPEYANRPEALD